MVDRHNCPGCAEREAELIEVRHRLRLALTGDEDGDLHAPIPEWVNNPHGVRNHEGMAG